jgi:hypothetical protein
MPSFESLTSIPNGQNFGMGSGILILFFTVMGGTDDLSLIIDNDCSDRNISPISRHCR